MLTAYFSGDFNLLLKALYAETTIPANKVIRMIVFEKELTKLLMYESNGF